MEEGAEGPQLSSAIRKWQRCVSWSLATANRQPSYFAQPTSWKTSYSNRTDLRTLPFLLIATFYLSQSAFIFNSRSITSGLYFPTSHSLLHCLRPLRRTHFEDIRKDDEASISMPLHLVLPPKRKKKGGWWRREHAAVLRWRRKHCSCGWLALWIIRLSTSMSLSPFTKTTADHNPFSFVLPAFKSH